MIFQTAIKKNLVHSPNRHPSVNQAGNSCPVGELKSRFYSLATDFSEIGLGQKKVRENIRRSQMFEFQQRGFELFEITSSRISLKLGDPKRIPIIS